MKSHTLIGIIIVLVGLSILLRFPLFNVLFAMVVIWIGVKVISGKNKDFHFETKGTINEDYLKRVLIFSGINVKLSSRNFSGGEVVAVFGGGEIDASEVKTESKNIDLELTSIFGGIKLKVPKDWEVKDEGTAIVGGFENRAVTTTKPAVTLHIKGAAIFGGVEIVN